MKWEFAKCEPGSQVTSGRNVKTGHLSPFNCAFSAHSSPETCGLGKMIMGM